MSSAAPLAAATAAQTTMELRLTARRGENVLVTIVIPVVVLLFFASVSVLPTGTVAAIDSRALRPTRTWSRPWPRGAPQVSG